MYTYICTVLWLDEGEKIKNQGGDSGSLNLILLKKYYSTNTDLGLVASSGVLLKYLYSQVLGIHTEYTVEPLNNGHVGTRHFVLCREVVLSSEVRMY